MIMTRWIPCLALSFVVPAILEPRARAGEESVLWITDTDGTIESGWVVSLPSGSSDYFSVAHDVVTAPQTEELCASLPITAMSISVADFGAATSFPRVGVYRSNLGLDASGNTPDLGSPLVQVFNPALSPTHLFDFVPVDTGEVSIPSGATKVHAVVQLPNNDTGQLAVGADTNSTPRGTSFQSEDGYQTLAKPFFGNLGLNIGQDNGTSKTDGRLRVSGHLDDETGDKFTIQVSPGEDAQLALFTPHANDKWMLYVASSAPGCVPLARIGGVVPVNADPDGDGGYLRTGIKWPFGFGGQTFKFTAAYGDTVKGGHGFTNCVTIITRPELPFGVWDDGRIDDAWFISLPSGPSDFFSVDFLSPPASVKNVIGITLAPMDFGAASPSFPQAGVAPANMAIDPTGLTPDIVHPLAVVAPFTFPPGTMATTAGQYITRAILPLPGFQLPAHTIGFVQFPPGDSGFLALGADTDSAASGYSTWTNDGFHTPAHQVLFANWGIRLLTN
jgi:hypothetical protein